MDFAVVVALLDIEDTKKNLHIERSKFALRKLLRINLGYTEWLAYVVVVDVVQEHGEQPLRFALSPENKPGLLYEYHQDVLRMCQCDQNFVHLHSNLQVRSQRGDLGEQLRL